MLPFSGICLAIGGFFVGAGYPVIGGVVIMVAGASEVTFDVLFNMRSDDE